MPREKSSHKTTPNDNTSDWLEKTISVSDSGAIPFTGNLPLNNKLPQLNILFNLIHSAGLLLDTTWDEFIGQMINDIQHKYLTLFHVVFVLIKLTGQTEIGHFDDSFVG